MSFVSFKITKVRFEQRCKQQQGQFSSHQLICPWICVIVLQGCCAVWTQMCVLKKNKPKKQISTGTDVSCVLDINWGGQRVSQMDREYLRWTDNVSGGQRVSQMDGECLRSHGRCWNLQQKPLTEKLRLYYDASAPAGKIHLNLWETWQTGSNNAAARFPR